MVQEHWLGCSNWQLGCKPWSTFVTIPVLIECYSICIAYSMSINFEWFSVDIKQLINWRDYCTKQCGVLPVPVSKFLYFFITKLKCLMSMDGTEYQTESSSFLSSYALSLLLLIESHYCTQKVLTACVLVDNILSHWQNGTVWMLGVTVCTFSISLLTLYFGIFSQSFSNAV